MGCRVTYGQDVESDSRDDISKDANKLGTASGEQQYEQAAVLNTSGVRPRFPDFLRTQVLDVSLIIFSGALQRLEKGTFKQQPASAN